MWKINASLLPAKGHYFAYFASQAGILPFGATIAYQFGASPGLIGAIYMTLPFFSLIAKPSFGVLADKLQQKKPIFLSCVLIMTAAFFAISLIPPVVVTKKSASLLCWNQTSVLEMCNFQPSGDSTEAPITSCDVTCHISTSNLILDHLCTHHPSYCPPENSTAVQNISFTAGINFSEPMPSAKEGCSRHDIKSFEIFNRTESIPMCIDVTAAPCNIICDDGESSGDAEATGFGVNSQIIYFWVLMIVAYICMGTSCSMGDTIVLNMLPNYGDFGKQRLYGGMGFGILAIVNGQLVDTFSEGSAGGRLNFMPAFCVLLAFGVIDLIVASRLTEKKVEKPKHLLKNVTRLFLNAETMLLTMAVFLVGFFSAFLWVFLIVYLVQMGANQLLIGLSLGVQCFLGEIPFMFVSDWFLKKIGHGHSMTLVLAVFGIRFLLYYLMDDPWLVLPIETTQGICFGIFFTALATYANIIAPPSSQATVQGILQAVFEGLGAGAGSLFGGLIYQALGGKMMWLLMGSVSCVCAILYGLILVVIQRRPTKNSKNIRNYPPRIELEETETMNVSPKPLDIVREDACYN